MKVWLSSHKFKTFWGLRERAFNLYLESQRTMTEEEEEEEEEEKNES